MSYDFGNLTQASTFLTSLANPVKRDITTVNGYREAQEFRLMRGEKIILLDSSDNIIYVKSADDFGKYDLKVFSCTDITEKFISQNTPASITKAEYENLTAKLDNLTRLLGDKNEYNAKSKSNEFNFSDNSVCKSTETNKSKS